MSLSLHQVTLTIAGRPLVKGVSLDLRAGEVVGLLGPNGAGKTTTFNLVTGLLRPDAGTVLLHPADVPFFIEQCKTPGKPVNFVPVIDKDVRRGWRSDSLWQAHDSRYTADQVCIIPGTAAVAGITRVDEPVGDLLDRFEKAAVDEVLAAGVQPQPAA